MTYFSQEIDCRSILRLHCVVSHLYRSTQCTQAVYSLQCCWTSGDISRTVSLRQYICRMQTAGIFSCVYSENQADDNLICSVLHHSYEYFYILGVLTRLINSNLFGDVVMLTLVTLEASILMKLQYLVRSRTYVRT